MSGTTLNVTLSSGEQTALDEPGAYAYAVYFAPTVSGGTAVPIWTTLVNDGTIENGGMTPIQLTDAENTTLSGAKVYFLVQSVDPSTTSTLTTDITTQSQIGPTSAAAEDYGYDSFEVTLSGSGEDAGNLTSVNGFGLPMGVSVEYDNGTSASVGYAVSGGSIASSIGSISSLGTATYSAGPLAGDFSLSTSPTEADNLDSNPTIAFPASAWLPYIESLEGSIASGVTITGQFNGAADAAGTYHNAGYYAYALSWVADGSAPGGGDFWLTPQAGSQIQGDIEISAQTLEQNIYAQTGSVTIYDDNGTTIFDPAMNVGANNQWGAILAQFFTGFTAGYYEATGTPLNSQDTTPIDLSENFNWDPTYAFGTDTTITNGGTPIAGQTSDPYSKLFFDQSNSYGWSYSDALTSQYDTGGPLLTVGEPGGGDVPDINLTIYADGETPQGYTTPVIDNYIASAAGGYAVPSEVVGGNNLVLSFLSAAGVNEGVDLAQNATITLSILTSDTGGVPSWSTVTFDGASQSGSAGDGLGLWQAWTITGNAQSGYAASVEMAGTPPNQTPIAQANGSMLISNLPTAASGVSWYQITVGAGTAYAKTYNLYLTTGGNGQILNPNYTGQAGALAVDGLARVTPQASSTQYITSATVNFAVGSTVTYNPNLVIENSGSVNNLGNGQFPSPAPTAPVAGMIGNGGSFTVLAGQTDAVTNTITTTISDGLVFGWTGDNPASYVVNSGGTVTTNWIKTYTNKVNPGDTVEVTITNTSGLSGTITTQADIDGAWQTAPENAQLGNGQYTITMQDLVSVTSGGSTVLSPVTSASDPLILTVQNGGNAEPDNSIAISCFRAGTAIATPRGPVAVEELRLGDIVLTAEGAALPVLWIGHRTVDCSRHPRPEQVWPVRIKAGAFEPQAPLRDLFLSPDHAVHAEGVLIPVKYLVNGTTVAQLAVETVTYLHIELERHQLVLAEGLAVESYLDTGDRRAFANGPDAALLHPAWGGEARDVCLVMEAMGYAPLRVAGAVVETVRDRLAARAGIGIIAA
jgi:hypothetical protein